MEYFIVADMKFKDMTVLLLKNPTVSTTLLRVPLWLQWETKDSALNLFFFLCCRAAALWLEMNQFAQQ